MKLGIMCADDKDIEELNEMYGLLCSRRGRAKDEASTLRPLGDRMQEWKSQVDYINGPRGRNDDAYIYNGVKLWDSWDHCLVYARIQEGESARNFPEKKRKKWTGWSRRQKRKKLNSRNK